MTGKKDKDLHCEQLTMDCNFHEWTMRFKNEMIIKDLAKCFNGMLEPEEEEVLPDVTAVDKLKARAYLIRYVDSEILSLLGAYTSGSTVDGFWKALNKIRNPRGERQLQEIYEQCLGLKMTVGDSLNASEIPSTPSLSDYKTYSQSWRALNTR